MYRKASSLVALLLLVATAPGSRASAADSVALSIDVSKAGPKIDRNLFGQFAEHLGTGIYEGVWVGPDSTIPNTRGVRNDVVAALKALKVPNVRWPGGCFADEYHWRKGIGPERPATLNPNWGGVIEPNSFGTHEFMDFVEQIAVPGNGRVRHRVTTPAGSEDFDLVVSNADLHHTYDKLLRGAPTAARTTRRLESLEWSMSLFVLYFGTDRLYRDRIAHHTVVFGPRYRELLDDIFKGSRLPDDFSLYLHAPTVTDPSLAPEGWPAIRDNEHGLSRLVYGFMIDRMRRVSEHVTIGRANRHGKDFGSWFMLCRETRP